MKKLFWFIIFLLYTAISYSLPVNPDNFPDNVRDGWNDANNLRELPEYTIQYIANEETVIDSNGVQKFVPFMKDSLFDNSESINIFIDC